MTKMKKKWLYRALCGALAVALVSGTAIMSPVADFVGTNLTVSAKTITESIGVDTADAVHVEQGDVITSGVEIWSMLYNIYITIGGNTTSAGGYYWTANKCYVVDQITYDDIEETCTLTLSNAVADEQSFLAAVANGGEIVLGADISLNQSVTISKACTIDFNGKKNHFQR